MSSSYQFSIENFNLQILTKYLFLFPFGFYIQVHKLYTNGSSLLNQIWGPFLTQDQVSSLKALPSCPRIVPSITSQIQRRMKRKESLFRFSSLFRWSRNQRFLAQWQGSSCHPSVQQMNLLQVRRGLNMTQKLEALCIHTHCVVSQLPLL